MTDQDLAAAREIAEAWEIVCTVRDHLVGDEFLYEQTYKELEQRIATALSRAKAEGAESKWLPAKDAPSQEKLLLGSSRLRGWHAIGFLNALGEWRGVDGDLLTVEPTCYIAIPDTPALSTPKDDHGR